MMESIVITGGAGFVGANFARYALAKTDARIVVIDKLTYAGNLCSIEELFSHPRFIFVKADISDRDTIESVFNNYQPTAVVNLAAETHVDRSIDDPRPFIDSNIVGTYQLLEVSRQYVARARLEEAQRFRFLHVSTDEVFGTLGASGFFAEDTPYAPNSPYAASKAAADHLARAYYETYRLPVLITNCSNNYGPFQFPEKLIPLMVLNAIDAKPLPIYGDGGNIRDWLFVQDHCSGLLLVLRRGELGAKYNIGGANERTNLEVVGGICEALERVMPAAENAAMSSRGLSKYSELKTFVTDRPGHDRRYAIDASKIRRELGWEPVNSFEDGVTSTVSWYVENRGWCEQVQAGKYARERLGLNLECSGA